PPGTAVAGRYAVPIAFASSSTSCLRVSKRWDAIANVNARRRPRSPSIPPWSVLVSERSPSLARAPRRRATRKPTSCASTRRAKRTRPARTSVVGESTAWPSGPATGSRRRQAAPGPRRPAEVLPAPSPAPSRRDRATRRAAGRRGGVLRRGCASACSSSCSTRGACFRYGAPMTAHPARFWLGLLAAFVLALWLLRHILLPFVLGMAVGYLLDPLVNRLARRGIPRAAAAGVIVFAAYGTSIAAVVLLAPVLARQVIDLVAKVPAYARAAYEALSPLLHRLEAGPGSARVAELAAAAAQRATDLLGPIAASLIGR